MKIERNQVRENKNFEVIHTDVTTECNITRYYVIASLEGRTKYIRHFEVESANLAQHAFEIEVMNNMLSTEKLYDFVAVGFDYSDGMGGSIDTTIIKFK